MSVLRVQVELDSNVRRVDNGTALLGGSPFRLVRLSAAGSRLLDRWLAGDDHEPSSEATELRRRLVRAGIVHPVPTRDGELPTVAFVIPVYEDVAGLDELLRALRRQCETARIVVVDDASSDAVRLAEVVERHGCELVRHAKNQGPGAARNTGWRQLAAALPSDGPPADVVIFVDADVVPKPGAVRAMLAHFADPDVSVVAPRVRAAAGSDSIASYEVDNSPLDVGPQAALVFPGTRVSYVPSAMLAVRASAIEQAGGFDSSLRFGEDVDLVWRLIDDDHMVRYEPAAEVEHRNRSSLTALARQRFTYGSSAAELAVRHGAKVAPLQLPVPVVAATIGLLFGRRAVRLIAALGAATAVVPLAKKLNGKVDSPGPEAARLALLTHGYALQGLAAAATRAWAPLLMFGRRPRRALAAALVVPAIIDWIRTRPANDPTTHLALRALDHGSYCAGVWAGALRSRSIAALLPSVRFAERDDD